MRIMKGVNNKERGEKRIGYVINELSSKSENTAGTERGKEKETVDSR